MTDKPKYIYVSVTNDLNQDQRMHRICNTLVDIGYRVTLVGRQKRKSTKLYNQKFDQYRLSCFSQSGVFFYFEYTIRLFFYLLFKKSDILYSVDLDTLIAISLISKLKSNIHIHDAHEYFVEVPELKGKEIKKKLWNTVGKFFLKHCDLRFTVNRELANILSLMYECEYTTLRSVPYLTPDQGGNKQDQKVILYQGMLNKGRGLEFAIRAMCNIDQAELHIVGEGDLSRQLRALVNDLGLSGRVKFLGWKSPQELQSITHNAWLGLNLLDGDSLNYKYSLANKFFDYMHAGVPSVNMNFPVYKRICAEDQVGICIDRLDVNTIHNTIYSLLHDHEIYDNLVQSCKVAKLKYNWQKESEILSYQLYKLIDQ